jgi:hypothetical protein
MTNPGFDRPLYILPFDHRGSFQKKMFGWDGALSAQQTAEIAAAKQVIYDAFITAVLPAFPKIRLESGSSIFGGNAGVATARSGPRASIARHKSTLLA